MTRVPAPVSLPGRSRGGGERAAAAGRSWGEAGGALKAPRARAALRSHGHPGAPRGLGATRGAVAVASPVARMSLPSAAGPPTRSQAPRGGSS